MSSHLAWGHGWTRVPKTVLVGRCDMISATQRRSDARGMTKEPCYRCAKGAGEKNWPKQKKVPKNVFLRLFRARGGGSRGEPPPPLPK